MSPRWIFRGLWAVTLLGLTGLLLTAAPAGADLAADHALMMEWLEGEFDNFQQVWVERETGAQRRHLHVHALFARVALPAFGEDVFYVKQYLDGDPSKLHRQRLFSFATEQAEGATVLRIYAFTEDAPYLDAHLTPSKLEGLTPEAMRARPGCEVYWRRDGQRFVGETKPGTCQERPESSVGDSLVLTRDELRMGEQARDEGGSHFPVNVPLELKRCRFFSGWSVLQRGEGSEEYDVQRGIRIHDQGGRFELGAGDKRYEVELAQLVQQSRQVHVLTLKLFEKGNDKAFAYAWTNPEAERIGINLRWIQTGFALEPAAQAEQGGER